MGSRLWAAIANRVIADWDLEMLNDDRDSEREKTVS